MKKILIRYEGNKSVRCDGKEFVESVSKIRRSDGSSGTFVQEKQ